MGDWKLRDEDDPAQPDDIDDTPVRVNCRCGHTWYAHQNGPCAQRQRCGCLSYRARPIAWDFADDMPRVHAEHDRDEAKF